MIRQLITYLKGVIFLITVNLSGCDYYPGYQSQSYENYRFILLIEMQVDNQKYRKPLF
jgi:hypothetical protein